MKPTPARPQRRRHAPGRAAAPTTVRVACPAGTRLVGSTHAVAFRQAPAAVGRAARRRPRRARRRRRRARRARHVDRGGGPDGRGAGSRRSARGRDDLRLAAPARLARRAAARARRLPVDRAAGRRGRRSRSRISPSSRRSRDARAGSAISSPALLLSTIALLCVAVARPRIRRRGTCRSCHRRARRRRLRLDERRRMSRRAGSRPRGRRSARSSTSVPVAGQGRPRRVRRRPGRGHLTDDRSGRLLKTGSRR